MTTQVNLGVSSPLLVYSATGGAWASSGGGLACDGSCAVELDSIAFISATFYYTASEASVQVGLDGTLVPATASGAATTTASSSTLGTHSARLEVDVDAAADGAFVLTGVVLDTELVESGSAVNATLDDAAAAITYTGFTSSAGSDADDAVIAAGDFYDGTVSYTATAGAAASFEFDGSALYLFGMSGPSMGAYAVSVDSASASLNASTPGAADTSGALLYFITGLDEGTHAVSLTALGGLLAFDYAVAVSSGGAGGTATTTAGEAATATTTAGEAATATATGVDGTVAAGSSGTGAIVGGVLGTLGGLFVLWLAYRYRAFKKAGGTGDCLTMLCGRPTRAPPPAAKAKAGTFRIWPYLKYQPKYATGD
ncbi:hypothetical protein Q5752_003145 [Cryptotrichosporon argae]